MDVELPKLADTLVEGTVTRWLKHAGDRVRQGEPLVEVETDKVNTELEAPADGVLSELLAAEGETVPVGQVIARIAGAGGTVPATSGPAAAAPQPVERGASRAERRAEHVRRAAGTVPQGVCAREVATVADDRLDVAVAAAVGAGWPEPAVLPASRSHLVMPALQDGQLALVVLGAPREGRRLLTLCFDRRVLDDWSADRLLREIAEAL